MKIHSLLCMTATAFLTACGGGGGGGGGVTPAPTCSIDSQKQFVLDLTNEWYLFPETLPAQVNLANYATPQALLDALTAGARAQGKDRFFSYVTTRQADSSFFGEGEFIGFGFRSRIDGNRVFFTDVFESTPASEAGLVRGAELLAVDSGSGFVPVATILATDPNLTGVFGPATEGVERGLRVRDNGVTTDSTLTKRIVTITPVPADGVAILTLPGNPGVEVGYVALRTYISTAQAPLIAAFGQFKARGITRFIIDVRYNGGGLLNIAQDLADLLGDARGPNDKLASLRYRASKSSNDQTVFFNPFPESVAPIQIAFITTDATASASELSVSIMDPYVNVAIVGGNTFGKPVGQDAFDQTGCDTRLRLITFRTTNALEEGDYFDGLANRVDFSCAAADDVSRLTSDPAEASTAEALFWLENNRCNLILQSGSAGLQKGLTGAELRWPEPNPESPVQYWMPGTF